MCIKKAISKLREIHCQKEFQNGKNVSQSLAIIEEITSALGSLEFRSWPSMFIYPH